MTRGTAIPLLERRRVWDRAYRERKRLGLPSPIGIPVERFLQAVKFDGSPPAHQPALGACWVWTGFIHRGYGRFMFQSKVRQAHRYAYETLLGRTIPAGLEPDHLCRNKACVRPSHVELVTHQVNCQRAYRQPQEAVA